MEDLLSLDDEVLQDTYIYHLPPDPQVIRLPSSLWVQVKSQLSAYLAKQRAGMMMLLLYITISPCYVSMLDAMAKLFDAYLSLFLLFVCYL
jgi:hypothetical protein